MKSRVGPGCLLVVLLLCAAGGYVVWRARTAPQVGESFAALSPAGQQERRNETKQFLGQIHDLQASARRKEHKPFSIAVTEPVLNTLLQTDLNQKLLNTPQFQVRDLRAGMEPNRLILQGHVNYRSVDTTATLTGNLVAQQGELAYQAESLQLGRMNIGVPDKMKQKAERTVSKQLNSLLKRAPGQITGVTVQDKQLTIEGVTD